MIERWALASSAAAGLDAGDVLIAIAALLAAALVLLAALGWGERGESRSIVMGMTRIVAIAFTRVWHGMRRVRPDPLPATGCAVVVANHRSGLDPLAVATHTRRQIRFLMAREYYETRGLRWLFRWFEAIPVRRDGNDLSATKEALRTLGQGRVIGVFPEGGIRNQTAGEPFSGESAEDAFKHGAALLALRSGAPVIPVYIDGTPPLDSVLLALLKPSRSRVVFGAPIELAAPAAGKASRQELEIASQRIIAGILELKRAAERRTAAVAG